MVEQMHTCAVIREKGNIQKAPKFARPHAIMRDGI